MRTALRRAGLAAALLSALLATTAQADGTPQSLPFAQDWTDTGLITTSDNWSGVPGIDGFRGDGLTGATGADPQTLLGADSQGVIDVNANQAAPNTNTAGGVTEFQIANPVVALQGSGTADAPYLKLYVDTTGAQDVTVAYTIRDIDGSADNAIQAVALQYRVGNTGDFTNVPAAFVADATTGPSLATLATPVSVVLPAGAEGQALVELRIITSNAGGSDEWVGIDDISVTAAAAPLRIAVDDVSLAEGEAGTTTASFTVSLNQPAPVGGVSFDVATANGTATAGSDYAARSLTGQVIAEGATSFTFDVQVNGDDVIEGADETFFVNLANVVGAEVGDAQGQGTIVEDDFPITLIHEFQGTGRASPVDGDFVVTRGIVTALRTNGYYLQTADAEVDADPLSSEGVFVFTGNNNVPAQAVVGNLLEVSGTVEEYTSSSNPHQQPLTELTGTAVVALLSTGNPLPAAVEITAALADPAGPVDNLERLEGMRVSIARLATSGPGEGFIDENDALSSANGNFWGVVEGVARPFREEGVGALDVTPGIPAATPVYDTNPERIRVQSTGQVGATVIAVDAQAVVSGLVGVLDYGYGTYTLLPDPAAPVTVEGGATPVAVADPTASEYTIAGFNLLRFYDDVNDAGGDVALTTVAFERRVAKTARAICEYVKTPDILGVVEVENLNALSRLADAINSNVPGTCERNPQYVAYLVEGNDVGKINIGFLVSTAEVRPSVPRVEVLEVVQYGKSEVISNPNGTTSILHDRPPLVLRAVVNAGNGATAPVTVVGNHLLSLIDINSLAPGSNGYPTTGDRRRTKRALQAEYTAALIEQFQQANPSERIVLLGDFNAFEFSDGYVDVMGILTGREAANDAVLEYVDSPVTVPLTNMSFESAEGQNYSFTFEGSAQTLDHLVVNQALIDAAGALRTEHARINADFGVDNFGDDAVPLRSSDHDPVVLFVDEDGFRSVDLGLAVTATGGAVQPGSPVGFQATLSNAGPQDATDVLVSFSANAELPSLAVTAPAGFTCAPAVVAAGATTVDCVADTVAAGSTAFTVTAGTSASTAFEADGLTLSASVATTSNDGNGANDEASATAPMILYANLVLYKADTPAAIVYAREAVVGYRVNSRGPHAAPATALEVSFNRSLESVTPEAPAGWSCALDSVTSSRQTFRCGRDGAYPNGGNEVLRFRVRANQSTKAYVTAEVESAAIDSQTSNNRQVTQFTVGLGSY
ncbi:MAG: DUF11 domain-containing protein [Rhizobium sp.]|nr:DUF11 domain-containing protein [Rhizobium sp.]